MCLALKFGGPIVATYVQVMKEQLHEQCETIKKKVRTANAKRG
jgi:hypothetical protein